MLHATHPEARRMLGMICFLEPVSKDFQEKEALLLEDKTGHWKRGDRSTDSGRGRVRRKKGHSSKECRRGGKLKFLIVLSIQGKNGRNERNCQKSITYLTDKKKYEF